MSRSIKARQALAAATRTPVELTPLRKMIRLPVADAMPHLTSGPAAIRLPLDVVSLEYRYHPKHTSIGSRQFMGHYAPQIAYNNPHIPFTFTRLGKAPEIKPASAEGEAPAAAKTETTADDSAVDAAEADETSTESEPKKGELAPSSLILSLKNGQTRTIETKDVGVDQILAELLSIVNVAGGPQVDAPEKLPALESPGAEATPETAAAA